MSHSSNKPYLDLTRHPHLIIEVAHPSVTAEYGALFLKEADFLVPILPLYYTI